ncbi:MAG: hypothetical protein ACYTF1_14405 [Planctomycetota bacterium]
MNKQLLSRLLMIMVFTIGFVRPVVAQRLDRLEILHAGYPRAFYFRATEAMARDARWSFEKWRRRSISAFTPGSSSVTRRSWF